MFVSVIRAATFYSCVCIKGLLVLPHIILLWPHLALAPLLLLHEVGKSSQPLYTFYPYICQLHGAYNNCFNFVTSLLHKIWVISSYLHEGGGCTKYICEITWVNLIITRVGVCKHVQCSFKHMCFPSYYSISKLQTRLLFKYRNVGKVVKGRGGKRWRGINPFDAFTVLRTRSGI